jgi:multiple sugar transport system permease protein
MTTLDALRSTTLRQETLQRPVIGYFRLRAIITTAIAVVTAVLFIWPFLCMLGQSFNRLDVHMNPLWPIPTQFTTQLYEMAITRYQFNRYIWNSVQVVFSSTALNVFACALAGYALAKCEFPGRNLLFGIILAIMLLPSQTMLVPSFVVMRQLGLINNYWGLILPAVGGNAYGIFLMRQFMLQVPTEMLEAARIDGASEFGLFTRVVLPTMLAPIGVLATLALRGSWNALLWPQILITDENKMLVMPAIARLNNLTVADPFAQPAVIAASIVAALLPLALYAYSQRYFVATLAGAIKG